MARQRGRFWIGLLTVVSVLVSLSALMPRPVRVVVWVLAAAAMLQALPVWWVGRRIQRRRQQAAFARLQRVGGRIAARCGHDPRVVVAIDLAGSQVADDDLEVITGFRQLEIVDLAGTNVSDEGLQWLSALKYLRLVNLAETNVTDATIATFAYCPRLEGLCLRNTSVTPEVWEALHWTHPDVRLDFGTKSDDVNTHDATRIKAAVDHENSVST